VKLKIACCNSVLKAGTNEFFSKPILASTLLESLEKHLLAEPFKDEY